MIAVTAMDHANRNTSGATKEQFHHLQNHGTATIIGSGVGTSSSNATALRSSDHDTSASSRDEYGEASIRMNDVICGRGKVDHAGNTYFRQAVAEKLDDFKHHQQLKDRHGMSMVVQSIVEKVHSNGGRFMDQNWRGMWVELSEKDRRQKVDRACRDAKKNSAASKGGVTTKQLKVQHEVPTVHSSDNSYQSSYDNMRSTTRTETATNTTRDIRVVPIGNTSINDSVISSTTLADTQATVYPIPISSNTQTTTTTTTMNGMTPIPTSRIPINLNQIVSSHHPQLQQQHRFTSQVNEIPLLSSPMYDRDHIVQPQSIVSGNYNSSNVKYANEQTQHTQHYQQQYQQQEPQQQHHHHYQQQQQVLEEQHPQQHAPSMVPDYNDNRNNRRIGQAPASYHNNELNSDFDTSISTFEKLTTATEEVLASTNITAPTLEYSCGSLVFENSFATHDYSDGRMREQHQHRDALKKSSNDSKSWSHASISSIQHDGSLSKSLMSDMDFSVMSLDLFTPIEEGTEVSYESEKNITANTSLNVSKKDTNNNDLADRLKRGREESEHRNEGLESNDKSAVMLDNSVGVVDVQSSYPSNTFDDTKYTSENSRSSFQQQQRKDDATIGNLSMLNVNTRDRYELLKREESVDTIIAGNLHRHSVSSSMNRSSSRRYSNIDDDTDLAESFNMSLDICALPPADENDEDDAPKSIPISVAQPQHGTNYDQVNDDQEYYNNNNNNNKNPTNTTSTINNPMSKVKTTECSNDSVIEMMSSIGDFTVNSDTRTTISKFNESSTSCTTDILYWKNNSTS